MYNNTNQYPPSGYASSYPVYQNYGAGYNYPGYGYQEAQSNQPVSSGGFSQSNWTPINQPNYSVPPPQPPGEAEGKTDAVVQEIQQQKATLTKQREDYVRKALVLRRESEQLRQQKQQLADGDMSDRELLAVLRKNEKLQEEINGKLKAILNVVEMLSTIIRDGKKIGDLEAELEQEERNATYTKQQSVESSRYSPSSIQTERSREPESRERNQLEKEVDKRYCYVYYDTGLHWCRACDEFPETAKEYLQHLQNKDHQDMAKENEVDITPWHKLPLEPVLPSYDDAPKKRLPIKGLQFFISAPSWYCKLCDVWIGDLHCASHHLKSVTHSQNYKNFVEQNPHWETEWLKDRETAMTRNGKHHSSDSDSSSKKKKRKHRASIESLLKEKKKKKRSKKKRKDSSDSSSSSSSSESSSDDEDSKDRSKSIRVAMRNMTQVKSIINEDMSKWTVLEKLLEDHRKKDNTKISNTEDELINQWMTVADPAKEKNIIETLKDRMRVKQEVEKAKWAEMEKRRKEKERQEQEMLEMKERQMREEAERLEREKARREQEEYQRIVDKDNRGHVKFRPSRDHYRRRKSASDDEEEEKRHRVNESPKHRREHESQYSKSRHSPEHKNDSSKRRPPGPPSYKKLPFIGRMPLFKKKQDSKNEREEKVRSIKKEEYEPQRKTRENYSPPMSDRSDDSDEQMEEFQQSRENYRQPMSDHFDDFEEQMEEFHQSRENYLQPISDHSDDFEEQMEEFHQSRENYHQPISDHSDDFDEQMEEFPQSRENYHQPMFDRSDDSDGQMEELNQSRENYRQAMLSDISDQSDELMEEFHQSNVLGRDYIHATPPLQTFEAIRMPSPIEGAGIPPEEASSPSRVVHDSPSSRQFETLPDYSRSLLGSPPVTRIKVVADMCWSCGQRGHMRRVCSGPFILFCSRCGLVGTTSLDCPCRPRRTKGQEKNKKQ
ncbi:zinc finger matrin-type protein CG9776 isoform X2 [Sitophilus oryzae]|nr:zinc finger matrin-type protein CG9776 isoform X2 [Sitophilus oryzae]XP_030766968.1 zinc finger matrin-type protein CG9776 isoform X2 [Sitophilus oryzae]XP_030766976.1 zinc finger matrin-type protein CG9776 isoform X2 [Sitophilus oryzae]